MSIVIKKIHKKFKENTILNIDNFEFSNNLYKLIGKNGSGKSTLLEIIAGIDKHFEGKIISKNKDILYLNSSPIGISTMTIEDNLKLLWKTFKLFPNSEELKYINSLFDNNLNIPYATSSTGTKAKLGLSLLVFNRWDTILIDETLATIDEQSLFLISNLILRLKKEQKTTIIYVAHNIQNTKLDKNANIIILEKGKLNVKNK
ncbi:MAG: ATP-binding cassette domain-containing protein [Lactobacillaceae bacterium]|jgi:ABC-type multidrug transport system ATPase subunit|nr:ATP-binding cassette domain-containing protein [Lactobacillaceae bacterium]